MMSSTPVVLTTSPLPTKAPNSKPLYSYMEDYALSIISTMKSQHMSLFPVSGEAITVWLHYPKWKQLEMASYPKLVNIKG